MAAKKIHNLADLIISLTAVCDRIDWDDFDFGQLTFDKEQNKFVLTDNTELKHLNKLTGTLNRHAKQSFDQQVTKKTMAHLNGLMQDPSLRDKFIGNLEHDN